MSKRARDEDYYERDLPKRGRGGANASFVFKVLLPDNLVAHLIGHGGTSRKALEDETGAHVHFSGRDEFFPGSRLRTVVISGESSDIVLSALDRVLRIVVEFGEVERDGDGKGKGKADDATTLLGKEAGEYIFRAAMPAGGCTGRLIGSGGSNIKKLRQDTGAKVFIDNDTLDMHQLMRVIGTYDAISMAFPTLVEAIAEELPEDQRASWASKVSYNPDNTGGKGAAGKEAPRKGGKGSRKSDYREIREDQYNEYNGKEERWPEKEYDAPDEGFVAPPEMVVDIAQKFPDGCLEMAHCISCELPSNRIGNLIGKRGDFVNHVQHKTGAQVKFSESNGYDDSHRTMTVTGPLVSVYAAHMMMMSQYHEGEIALVRSQEEKDRPPEGDVQELQAQLADLQAKLAAAQGGSGDSRPRKGSGGGKGSKGKGKR